MTTKPTTEIAVFGGGCFWCTEAIFQRVRGVVSVQSGYAGGTVQDPTYEQVSSGNTGHAEVLRIEFDPAVITYEELLDIFFHTHDPTTMDRQGADVGTQYRSSIFVTNPKQEQIAKETIIALSAAKEFEHPVVTTVQKLTDFFPAESYHADYYNSHQSAAYCQLVITPKLSHFLQQYEDKLSSGQ